MKFCEKPFHHVYLAPNGEVWPCGWMHFPIGNIYEQDFDEIWRGERAKRARESILDGSFCYCRKTSCPFCERGDLPDLTQEELREKAEVPEVPENITFANDRICNIACTTCRKSLYLPEEGYRERIDAVLKRMRPYAQQAAFLDMNGNGEFLANPSFLEFLESFQPQRSDFCLSFETNGVLFDEEHWNRFSHLGNYHIEVTVTLNSLRREIYRYLSGGYDKVEAVRRNLRFLSGLRRKNQINVLKATMVVQECNFQEIPEYVRTLTQSEELEIDQIVLKPVYKWFGMDEETYWFKNILNPLHPYHKEYLKILEDPCWNAPKVYDWGCHNLREARPHPMRQEKVYNRLLLDIYENAQGLSPAEYVRRRAEEKNLGRVGVFGENETARALLHLLRQAGAEVVFQLTWFQNEDGALPKVSMQNFRPDMADTVLLLDFYDRQNLTGNLRTLKFQGQILTAEELIEGTPL